MPSCCESVRRLHYLVLPALIALLVQEHVPDKVNRYMKQAKNSGMMLLHLINDILDMTRIESGQMQLEPRSFSVSARPREMPLVRRLASRPAHIA